MRVIVLGGTVFIGRAIVTDLIANGHEVLVVHRGKHEPTDLAQAQHLHTSRERLREHVQDLSAFAPDAAVDTTAMTREGAEVACAALPRDIPVVVLSSIDVYRAYGRVIGHDRDRAGEPVPLGETAPLRSARDLFGEGYEKLDVEDVYAGRNATICRLSMVYGDHDPRRREEFVLRRLRAGRPQIPIGAGNWLASRVHVADVAIGVRSMLESGVAVGKVFNLAEPDTATMADWVQQIIDAAGAASAVEVVRVHDSALSPDLQPTAAIEQHLLVSATSARAQLGWTAESSVKRVAQSVKWHLAYPPSNPDQDFSADDAALASLGPERT